MKLPIYIAKGLISILNGEKAPYSGLKHPIIDSMLENGVLKKQVLGRSKALIFVTNTNTISVYLKNHFGIEDLKSYIEVSQNENISRAEAIEISSDSKLKTIRTFKGFLVNCFQPIECKLGTQKISIQPQEGTFTFIYDYENFTLPGSITVIGIENPENFRHIQKQSKLFTNIQPLFVSRYPQNKDLIKWLQSMPNNYLHFGDFDFAGLNIYWNEYKKYLKSRSKFFLPANVEELIIRFGNRNNYDNQKLMFNESEVEETEIISLIRIIEKYKKGLEQEIFIRITF